MPYYITVSRGPRADSTVPVMALSDPRIIRAVLAAIADVMGADLAEEAEEHEETGTPPRPQAAKNKPLLS